MNLPLSVDDRQRMRFRLAMARKKRREREAEGEIKALNITAMMDMMTIILVFLLKSYTASAVSMTSSDELRPPVSSTRMTPKDTVAITITPRSVMLGDRKIFDLRNGQVPTSVLSGRLVVPLDIALHKEVEKLKTIERYNAAAPFNHELSIIGDKSIPYDVLLTVLYTAGHNELENYRFIVLQRDDSPR